MRKLFFLSFLLACFACSTSVKQSVVKNGNRYAKGFSVKKQNGIVQLDVFNPWENADGFKYSYYLVPKTMQLPDSLKNRQVIRTPVERVVCLSTTHVGFLEKLGFEDFIVGVSGQQYITNEKVRANIASGKVSDVGYDQNLNYELLLHLKPDIVMAYGVGSEVASYISKLKDLGLSVVMNAEYLEETPLGRAEWLVFTGALFGKEDYASEVFSGVEKRYVDVEKQLELVKHKPVVITGISYKENWWIPGGRSYMANLIADAGGDYLWKDNQKRESQVISLEKVIVESSAADYWINCGYASSLKELKEMDERFAVIKPLKEAQVFNDNKRLTPNGGNDVWETGVACPDVLLKDLAAIFHPEIFGASSLYYYQKLGE